MKYLVLILTIVLGPAGWVMADNITIDGKKYTDVLINESSSTYYVRVPNEGRSISALKSQVDESSVSINDDPFYRDQLKAKYDWVKTSKNKGGGEAVISDPAFQVGKEKNSSSGASDDALLGAGGVTAPSGGGGGGKGLGMPRQMLMGLLQGQGMQFSGSGNTFTGKTPDGTTTIQLIGPAENLTGLNVQVQFPEAQKATVQQGMSQMGMLAAQSAPWFMTWVQGNVQTLMNGGNIEKTQDGVKISISVSYAGGMGTLQLKFASV